MFGSPLGNERLTGIVPGRWPGITLLPEWRYATLNHTLRQIYLFVNQFAPLLRLQSAGILSLHAEAGKRIVCGGPNQFHMRGWVQG
jgi:hypothetical protein